MGRIFINHKIIETDSFSIENNILYIPYPDTEKITICKPGRRIQLQGDVNVKTLKMGNCAVLTGNVKFAYVNNCAYVNGKCKSHTVGNRICTLSGCVKKEIKREKESLKRAQQGEQKRCIVHCAGNFTNITFDAKNITMSMEINLNGDFDTVYIENCLFLDGNVENITVKNSLYKSE